jgi:hypothetical protein
MSANTKRAAHGVGARFLGGQPVGGDIDTIRHFTP